MLRELQERNKKWPVYYPSPTSPQSSSSDPPILSRRSTLNPTSQLEESKPSRPENAFNRRSSYSNRESNPSSSSSASETSSEPRLVSAKEFGDFNVFKLDLQFGSRHMSSAELIHQLEKTSVASLLDDKLLQIMRHLLSLRDRIDDTTSKVLITGDLNAGKSTFCNALLRRQLLPEDQQPCTSVFCEVIDARENHGVEEVHAVPIDTKYNRSDDTTFEIYSLKDLEDLVSKYEKYSILKVYINDRRPVDQSLLRNGVVDICLIDAPGLNMDSYQTTQVFSRQEEIDLVVFVVSAENHFTLSAKEFIWNAAHEKSLVFIVVNRFDNIKNKEKCQRRILDQVASLSPETHKDARDFIHFVSSSQVLNNMDKEGNSPDGGDDDGPSPDSRDDPEHPDFDRLEASLRNFVLEKRSLSKLMPAKTYLKNMLKDLEMLAFVNIQVTDAEKDRVVEELNALAPEFEKSKRQNITVSEEIDNQIEAVGQQVFDFTEKHLIEAINKLGETPVVPYSSVFSAFSYAVDTRETIIDSILTEVEVCESYAKRETTIAINAITSVGVTHLGIRPVFNKKFNEGVMFTRKKDTLSRSIYADLTIWDLFDINIPLFSSKGNSLEVSGPKSKEIEKSSSSSITNALTLASVVTTGQLIRSTDIMRSVLTFSQVVDSSLIKKLAVPALAVGALCGIAYIVYDIPYAVARNVSRKLRYELNKLGYVQLNANRISRECRKVLRYPAQDIRAEFQTTIEEQARKKEEYTKTARDIGDANKYFKRLHKEVVDQHKLVEKCNLESNLPVD